MRTRSGRGSGDRRDGSDRRSPEPQGKFASPLHFGGLHFEGRHVDLLRLVFILKPVLW